MVARQGNDPLNGVAHSYFRLIAKRNCFRASQPSSLQSLTIRLTKHRGKESSVSL